MQEPFEPWKQEAELLGFNHPLEALHAFTVRDIQDAARAPLRSSGSVLASIARSMLDKEPSVPTPMGYDLAKIAEVVASEEIRYVDRLLERLATPLDLEAALEATKHAGMLWIDDAASDELARIGPKGKEHALKIRSRAAELWDIKRTEELGDWRVAWALWRNLWPVQGYGFGGGLLGRIAIATWRDSVKPDMERLCAKPPALSVDVTSTIAAVTQSNLSVTVAADGARIVLDRHGNALANIPGVSPAMPAILADTAEALLSAGLGKLGSIGAHRLLRWLVEKVHWNWLRSEPDWRTVEVEGGWRELARLIGAGKGRKAAEHLRSIVVAYSQLCMIWPDGSPGALLILGEPTKACGTQSARIRMTVGDALLPHFVVGKLRKGHPGRALVPVVPLPPMVGRKNEYGPQAALQTEALMHMRRRARELSTDSLVVITSREWERMGQRSRVPAQLLPRVIDRWVHDGDDAPAFLFREGACRYALAQSYRDAHEFIRSAGEKEIKAAAAGKRSVARKSRQSSC